MPTTVKDQLIKLGAGALLCPFAAVYLTITYTIKGIENTKYAWHRLQQRRRVETRRLPKSQPLATPKQPNNAQPPNSVHSTNTETTFLSLPAELRLEIYRLALETSCIAQIALHGSYWGPRPKKWSSNQHIRTDADPPSESLRLIIGLGGSGLKPIVAPPSRGCVRYGCVTQLVLGGEQQWRWKWPHPENEVSRMDLLCVSRVIYGEVLDVIYSTNTISLFGTEIARYFCRNAGPEGLMRVRYVHLVLVLSAQRWGSRKQKRNVVETVGMMREKMPGLKKLDLEVVVLWNQPVESQKLWVWLRNEVFMQLGGLDECVLKVVVYKTLDTRFAHGYEGWKPECEPLETWNEDAYRELKAAVTSRK